MFPRGRERSQSCKRPLWIKRLDQFVALRGDVITMHPWTVGSKRRVVCPVDRIVVVFPVRHTSVIRWMSDDDTVKLGG